MRSNLIRGAFAAALAVLLTAVMPFGTAEGQGQSPAEAPALTARDRIEIRQLAARYAYAIDTGADEGRAYAALFAPDGVFVGRDGTEVRGEEALAALAQQFARGRQAAVHFAMNHVIEPSPGGASGRQYLLQFRFGDEGTPDGITGGGHYRDEYVRTPDGWRFARREFVPSEGGARGGGRP